MSHAEELVRREGLATLKLESELQRSSVHVFYEALSYKMTKASKFYEKAVGLS